jgi:hypothetical protein
MSTGRFLVMFEAVSIQGDSLKIGPFLGSWPPSNADHDQRLVALELYHRPNASISPYRVPLSPRSRRRKGRVFPQDEGHDRAVLAEHRQLRAGASARPGDQIREGPTGGITIFHIHSRRANRPLATVMRSRCARWSLPSHRLWTGRSMAGPFSRRCFERTSTLQNARSSIHSTQMPIGSAATSPSDGK